MANTTTALGVRRIGDAGLMDIRGDVTAQCEPALAEAFAEASSGGIRAVILNFTALDYMNSGGIGLLVTLLVRANRQKQRLCAYGLNEHYRQIFELTRLDEAIAIFDTEDAAVASAR